jgi:hypothetical protein
MALKRKHEDPAMITYVAEIPWFRCLVTLSSLDRSEDLNPDESVRDPALAVFTNNKIVEEVSKLLYLVHHQVKDSSKLLQYLGLDSISHEDVALTKQLNLRQSQWKSAILNKFLLPHVKELERRWHVANAWRSFTTISTEERKRIWLDAYDEDPKGITTSMFKPVIGILDTDSIFNGGLDCVEDRAKMRRVRIMLRNKYLFGCEITYEHRVKTTKKVRGSCAGVIDNLLMNLGHLF